MLRGRRQRHRPPVSNIRGLGCVASTRLTSRETSCHRSRALCGRLAGVGVAAVLADSITMRASETVLRTRVGLRGSAG